MKECCHGKGIQKGQSSIALALQLVALSFFLLSNRNDGVLADASASKLEMHRRGTNIRDIDYDVVICGGGIVGLSTAVALSRLCPDAKIKVFERTRSLKPVGALFGLFPNGVTALRSICPHVCEKVLDSAVPYKGGIHKSVEGGRVVATRESTRTSEGIFFVVWYLLQRHLVDALPEGTLCLGNVFESYESEEQTGLVRVILADRESGTTKTVTCRVLIGADGIRSTVRRQLLGEDAKMHYHRRMMYRGVIDAAGIDDSLCPPRGYRAFYTCGEPGKGFVFGVAATGGIVAVTATVISEVPVETTTPATTGKIKERMRQIFANYPSDIHRIIDRMDDSAIYENAVYDIDMLENGWLGKTVILVGDAAHAMTPALGQGGNIGLEDSAELALSLAPVLLDILPEERDHAKCLELSCDDTKRQQDQIANVVEGFWRRRFPRVEEVHRISREQAESRNRGVDKSQFQKENQVFYEKLYGWTPDPGTA